MLWGSDTTRSSDMRSWPIYIAICSCGLLCMVGAQFIFLEDWAKRGAIAAIERSHRIKKVSEAPPRAGGNGGEEASVVVGVSLSFLRSARLQKIPLCARRRRIEEKRNLLPS